MSGGRVFDRPGFPPLDRPPPPGSILRPVLATRVAQAATALILAAAVASASPPAVALLVAPVGLLGAYRAYNAGFIRVESWGLVLRGLTRTIALRHEHVEAVELWFIRYRTAEGRERRWQLWPYAAFGVMLPAVRLRSEEVMECLTSLNEVWKSARPKER